MILPSALCFLVACATPALVLDGKEHQVVFGAQAFLEGPLAVLIGQLSWLAKPLWLLAALFVVLSRFKGATAVSLLAFGVANHAWALFGQEIPGDEGGVTKFHLTSFHVGFYLWLLSFLILAASAAIAQRRTAPSFV